jgi:large subunit ribosomal protein L32
MPQPKKKTSKSKRDSRSAHWLKLEMPNLFKCPQCGSAVLAHRVCPDCGTYKGRQVLPLKEPKSKAKA